MSLPLALRQPLSGLALLFLAASPAMALDIDQEFEEKAWAENEVQLPAFPVEENLIPFTVGALSDTRFYIDGNSISVGTDDVIRYTVVVISPSGARNISYEGMRCTTAEKRAYAFGRADQSWSCAKSGRWVRIKGGDNNYLNELFASYFCASGAPAIMKAEDARRALRYGTGVQANN